MTEFDGWARTVVRCGGRCGGELGTVYRTGAGLLLIGVGIGTGDRILGDRDTDAIDGRCSKCGRAGKLDPIALFRAARSGRRTFVLE
jgi:hypothetical protein